MPQERARCLDLVIFRSPYHFTVQSLRKCLSSSSSSAPKLVEPQLASKCSQPPENLIIPNHYFLSDLLGYTQVGDNTATDKHSEFEGSQ